MVAYIRICVCVLLAMVPQLCAEDSKPEAEVQDTPLEMLWKDGTFTDIAQAELAEMLKEVPHWRMEDKQWRVLGSEQMQFAGAPVPDVLFVWKPVVVKKRSKARADAEGVVMQLDYISCILFNRMEAKDSFPLESELKRLTDYFGRPPKKQQSKDKYTKVQTSTWQWSTRIASAKLSVVSHKEGSKEVVENALLTLTPLRREPRLSAAEKKAAEQEKRNISADNDEDMNKHLEERLSEWKYVNSPAKAEPGQPMPGALPTFLFPAVDAHEAELSLSAVWREKGLKAYTLERELSRYFPKCCLFVEAGRDPVAWRMETLAVKSKNKSEPNQVQVPNCLRSAVMSLSRCPVIIVVKNSVPSGGKKVPPVRLWLLLEYDSVQRSIRYAEFYDHAIVQKSISVVMLKDMMLSL